MTDGKAHVDYPASNGSALGCGGTHLAASQDTLGPETVWNSNGGSTGGGVSTLFARPDCQQGVTVRQHAGRKGGRSVPDVAADADPDSGYRVVVNGTTG